MPAKPRVIWYPAHDNNFTPAKRPRYYVWRGRRYAAPINKVIVHVTQGSWSSALNWFQNPNAEASAHYTVRSSDGRIGQSVSELNIAWHAGNWSYNVRSVGIEHEGYVSDPKWFTHAMYRSSARLAAYLCAKYRIPVDRDHIIGHNEVPGANHTDPGRYWNWPRYMYLVRQYR